MNKTIKERWEAQREKVKKMKSCPHYQAVSDLFIHPGVLPTVQIEYLHRMLESYGILIGEEAEKLRTDYDQYWKSLPRTPVLEQSSESPASSLEASQK